MKVSVSRNSASLERIGVIHWLYRGYERVHDMGIYGCKGFPKLVDSLGVRTLI